MCKCTRIPTAILSTDSTFFDYDFAFYVLNTAYYTIF